MEGLTIYYIENNKPQAKTAGHGSTVAVTAEAIHVCENTTRAIHKPETPSHSVTLQPQISVHFMGIVLIYKQKIVH